MRVRAVLLAMVCLGLGCATTVESTWKSPELKERRIKTFAVFGVAESPTGRVTFEEALTDGLRKRGLAAEPGYDFLSFDEKVDRAEIIKRLRGKNVDAVLVSRITGQDSDVVAQPLWRTAVATDPFYGGWYTYWVGPPMTSTGMVAQSFTERTQYVWETVLYDLEDNKPMWAARSVSSRSSSAKFGADIAGRVAADLKAAGLLPE